MQWKKKENKKIEMPYLNISIYINISVVDPDVFLKWGPKKFSSPLGP